jgi:hypothetical protein
MAYEGYKGIAEYMLRRSKNIKYVVLYNFPGLLPTPEVIRVADLGPIAHDALVGPKSLITPPSAFLSPYFKATIFNGYRYHYGDPLQHQPPALELSATMDDALGWLPEFDVRFDRITGRIPTYPDSRNGLLARLGVIDRSSIYSVLDDFNSMVNSYGAHLAIAFAPIAGTFLIPNDPNLLEADAAFARFSSDHPDVKMLFPLINAWSSEKFGMFNHVSREYTFLSSERLGRALERLLTDPGSIPSWRPIKKPFGTTPSIQVTSVGQADPELLDSALAFYIYNTTLDARYKTLISSRVLSAVESSQSYRYMIEDATKRIGSLKRRQIEIGYDLSRLQARRIQLSGMTYCDPQPSTEWIEIHGTMIFTYRSPEITNSEPVEWPESAHIFIPTILENGIRKFNGFCAESIDAMADSSQLD